MTAVALGVVMFVFFALTVVKLVSPKSSKSAVITFAVLTALSAGALFFVKNGALAITVNVMIVSCIAMMFCAKYQNSYANAQPLAIVVFICMIVILTITMGGDDSRKLIENEMAYSRAAAVVMGKYLAEKHPDSRALLLVSRDYEKNKRTMTILEGLREGFGSKISVEGIDFPVDPKREEEMEKMKKEGAAPEAMFYPGDDEFSLKAEHYNTVINKYPDANLIIFTSSLPHDVSELGIWDLGEDKRPKTAALFAEPQKLKNAIKAKYVSAITTYKPDVKFTEDKAPSDPQKAFDARYLLINSDNVDEMEKQHGNLFPK
jgi:hypothetical protein